MQEVQPVPIDDELIVMEDEQTSEFAQYYADQPAKLRSMLIASAEQANMLLRSKSNTSEGQNN